MDVLALALQDEGAMNTARSLLLLASLTGLTSLGCADPNPKTGGATSASTGAAAAIRVRGGRRNGPIERVPAKIRLGAVFIRATDNQIGIVIGQHDRGRIGVRRGRKPAVTIISK